MTKATATPKRQPLLSRVPADFVRAVLKGHSALGLAFAAVIYLVCLTGSLAVFAHEFERWEQARAPRVEHAAPAAVQRALAAAIAQTRGEIEHGYISLPGPVLPRLHVSIEERSWIADENGALTEIGSAPWSEFLTRLHINLHLPRTWGLFLVGLTGVALLSSLISGLLAHPRIFRDAFHLRLGGARRLQEADLHNRIGVWALPFHLIVSLTGALLGLTTLIVGVLGFALFQGDVNKVYGLFFPNQHKDDPRPAPVIDLVPMFAQVTRLAPDGRPDLILLEHPTEQGGVVMFNVERPGTRLANTDAFAFTRDGKPYYVKHATDNNLGENILASMGKLHFGWFGGGIVKIAYFLLGLGLSYLAAGGVTIWLARRRDKRRPAPRLERVWAGVVWGQPLALAVTALAAVAVSGIAVGALIAVWLAGTLATIAGAALVDPARGSRGLRLLTAGALVLTALAHAILRGGDDGVAWAIDAALLAGAIPIAWGMVTRRRGAPLPA